MDRHFHRVRHRTGPGPTTLRKPTTREPLGLTLCLGSHFFPDAGRIKEASEVGLQGLWVPGVISISASVQTRTLGRRNCLDLLAIIPCTYLCSPCQQEPPQILWSCSGSSL